MSLIRNYLQEYNEGTPTMKKKLKVWDNLSEFGKSSVIFFLVFGLYIGMLGWLIYVR